MAKRSGVLRVLALLDTREFTRRLDDTGAKLERFGRKASRFGDKFTKRVSLPIAAGLGATVKFASDLEQSTGAVRSVMGPAARRIEEFGDTAADSFGLSRREVNETAAVLGAQLQGMGLDADETAGHVINLQQRAADLAATFGGTTSEALGAISALLRGERDPIEKYGVSLKQVDVNARIAALGLDTTTVEAEKQATAIASLDLLMQQTKSTQGQFAAESESVAGKLARVKAEAENAAAEFGEQLLPVASDLLGVAGDLAGAFGALPDPMKTVIASAGILAVVTGPVIRGFGAVASAGGALIGKLRVIDATTGTTRISLAKLGTMLGRAGLVGAGLIVATQLLGHWLRKKQEAKQAVQDYTAALEADAGALAENTRKTVVNRLEQEGLLEAAEELGVAKGDLVRAILDKEGPAYERVNEQLQTHGTHIGLVSDEEHERRRSIELVKQALEGEIGAVEEAVESSQRQKEALEDSTGATDDHRGSIDDAAEAHDSWRSALEDSGDEADDLKATVRKLTDETEASTEAIQEQRDALREQIDPIFAAQRSLERLEEAQAAATEAAREHGPQSREAAAANRELASAAFDAQGDLLALKQEVQAGKVSIEKFDDQIDQLVANGIISPDAAAQAKREIRGVIDTAEEVEGVDPHVRFRIDHQEAIRKLREVRDVANEIPRDVGVRVTARGSVTERAHGGPVRRGRPYIVGERRPELFVPEQDGTILPHVPRHRGGPAGMQSAGPAPIVVNLHVQGSVLSEEDLVEVVRRGLDRVSEHNATSGVT